MNVPNDNGSLFDSMAAAAANSSFLNSSAPTSPRANTVNAAPTSPFDSSSGNNNANSSSAAYKINGAFLQQYANDILYNGGVNTASSISGASSVGGGDNGNSFDINSSDFPSLGGSAPVQSNVNGSANSSSGVSRQQQLQHSVQQQQYQLQQNKSNLYRLAMAGTNNSNFNMTTEDFPALPGAPPPSLNAVGNVSVGDSSSVSSVPGLYRDLQQVGVNVEGSSGNPTSSSNTSQGHAPSSSVALGLGGASGTGGNPGSSNAPTSSALAGDYGLLGLLAVIRMSDADRNALALGNDLTALGLNLNTSGNLYSTFASPWSESPTTREPHYQLPMCYYMQPPALKTGHLSKFHLETLVYIFYALPKDVLQAYAAQELYARGWRYHVDHKLWFKRSENSDNSPQNSAGNPQFVYFDIKSWECRPVSANMNQSITSGLLPEDEVRVKFSNS